MEDIKQIIRDAIGLIDETTTYFNQNKVNDGYKRLDKTLVQLDKAMSAVSLYRQEGGLIDIDEDRIVKNLTEAMKALENKDMLLLSDILEYEIKDMLYKGFLSLQE